MFWDGHLSEKKKRAHVCPRPSWPYLLAPQAISAPDSVIAIVCAFPQVTYVTYWLKDRWLRGANASTRCGALIEGISSSGAS